MPPAAIASSASASAPATGPKPDASPAEKAAYAQALAQCEAELHADYARRIENVVATGKPHFVSLLERRRGEALASLCPLQAENAAADQRIAENKLAKADKLARSACGNDQRAFAKAVESDDLATLLDRFKALDLKVTAGETNYTKARLNYHEACHFFFQLRKRTESKDVFDAVYRASLLADMAVDQSIAAGRAEKELFDSAKRIADKITNNTATPADAAELEGVYQSLKAIHASSPDKGIAEVLALLEGVLSKARRLRN